MNGSDKWQTYWLGVCGDCLHVAASGRPDYDGYADSGHYENYCQGLKNWGGEPFANNHDSEHPYFSRLGCEFCGDSYGGDRYRASVIVRA